MTIKKIDPKALTSDCYQTQLGEKKKRDAYDLDVKIKEVAQQPFTQLTSNIVGCGGGNTVTQCSGGCCQSLCSSC